MTDDKKIFQVGFAGGGTPVSSVTLPPRHYHTDYIVSLHSDPVWAAIWDTIKRWDINTPAYGGYCGANGDHVTQIYEAVKAAATSQQ